MPVYLNSQLAPGVTSVSENILNIASFPSNVDTITNYYATSMRSDGYVDVFTSVGGLSAHTGFIPNKNTGDVFYNAGGYIPVWTYFVMEYTKA